MRAVVIVVMMSEVYALPSAESLAELPCDSRIVLID